MPNRFARRRRGDHRAGFTLIEVLVAMVILAVGLLALEGMAIGAARNVARADRQGEFTAIAAAELETSLARFRQGLAVGNTVVNTDRATVTRIVTNFPATPIDGGNLNAIMVQVQVAPRAGFNHLGFRPVTVVGRASRSN